MPGSSEWPRSPGVRGPGLREQTTELTTAGVEELFGELEASGRFHRDSRLGGMFHPGKVAVAPLVGDLIDADPAEAGEAVGGRLGVGQPRVTIEPTVRHATRSSSRTADFEQWVTSHEQVSSKA